MKKLISAILVLMSLNAFAVTVALDSALEVKECSKFSTKTSYRDLKKETLVKLQESSAEKCSQLDKEDAEIHVFKLSEMYLLTARKVCINAALVCK